MSSKFGDRLKELRLEKNMTQEELAKSIGTGKASISHYESNRRMPELSKLEQLAKFFNVLVEYLTGRMPFKTKEEAYYSIRIGVVKHLQQFQDDIPAFFDIDTALQHYYSHKKHVINSEMEDADLLIYCESLLDKFESGLNLNNAESLDLSHIIFLEIRPYEDFNGLVFLTNYDCEQMAIRLDFNNIEKINRENIDISTSVLLDNIYNQDIIESKQPYFFKPLSPNFEKMKDLVNEEENDHIISRLANNIKIIREKRGYSVKELSSMINLNEETINMIESGKTGPNYATLISISKVLIVSLDLLLTEDIDEDYQLDLTQEDLEAMSKEFRNLFPIKLFQKKD